MSTRYYLHGDRFDGDAEGFYCKKCDCFESENHFRLDSHTSDNRQCYERCLAVWERTKNASKGRFYRPKDAFNLFASESEKQKPKPNSFYCWLIKQEDREDPIGDLAIDVKSDKNFPSEIGSLKILRNYLVKHDACEEAIQALEEAHQEHKSKTSIRSGISLSTRFEVFRRDDYCCQICRSTARDGARLEVDHKEAIANGGGNEMSNLWTLCFDCNRGKGTKSL